MSKVILRSGGFIFLMGMILNCFMWWGGLSLVASSIKTFGDCNQKYNIERFKVQTDWFCPTEDSKIDMILTRSEAGRNNKRR